MSSGAGSERIRELHPGAGGQVEGSEQVEAGAVGRVPGHLELRAHGREAHLAPRGVDGRAHAGVHQLPRLSQQLGRDGAVGLTGAHRLPRAQRAEVGEAGGGARDLAGCPGVEPRRDRRVPRGPEPADQGRVEDRLRGAELEPVDVERIGDPGGDGDPELVEVERLPGDAPRCR